MNKSLLAAQSGGGGSSALKTLTEVNQLAMDNYPYTGSTWIYLTSGNYDLEEHPDFYMSEGEFFSPSLPRQTWWQTITTNNGSKLGGAFFDRTVVHNCEGFVWPAGMYNTAGNAVQPMWLYVEAYDEGKNLLNARWFDTNNVDFHRWSTTISGWPDSAVGFFSDTWYPENQKEGVFNLYQKNNVDYWLWPKGTTYLGVAFCTDKLE